MEKEVNPQAKLQHKLYNKVQDLRREYLNALLPMPSFVETCAKHVFEGQEITSIDFEENGTRFKFESHASPRHDTLILSTADQDFFTTIILYSNTSALNGDGGKNGNIVYRRECIRPMRKNRLERQEQSVEGIAAAKLARQHIKELNWVVWQDFASK